MSDTHERCWLCAFHNGERCTHTFRLVFHVEPTGGQVEFITTPGMVPEDLKPKLEKHFKKLIDRLIPVIEIIPVWNEIREWQIAHHESNHDCPGRKEREDIKPYLKIVKT